MLERQADKLWTVAGGKRVLAQSAVLTAEMITGAAVGYAVEQMMPRAGAGAVQPSEDEAVSWILQGAAMGVGRFVAGRMQQMQERLALLAERGAHLRRRAVTQARLAARLERSGDSAAALHLLQEHHRLLRDEAELLADQPGAAPSAGEATTSSSSSSSSSSTAPAAARARATAERLGVDPRQLAVLRAGNAAAVEESQSSTLEALRWHLAGLEPLSASAAHWAGTRDQIEAALASAGPAARVVHHDEARRRWTVQLAGQQVVLSEVEHGRSPAAGSRGPGRAAIDQGAPIDQGAIDRQIAGPGHAQTDLHSHWMGNVSPEAMAAELARSGKAAAPGDVSRWEPLLRELYDLGHSPEGMALKHVADERGEVGVRGRAGDALKVIQGAQEVIELKRDTLSTAKPEEREKLAKEIDQLAHNAVDKALRASEDTDFNSAYELRDELVKRFYGAEDRRAVMGEATRVSEVQDKLLAHFAGRPEVLRRVRRVASWEAREAKGGQGAPRERKQREAERKLILEQFAYDRYSLDVVVCLARDKVQYTEQSNSAKKLLTRFDEGQLDWVKALAKREHPELAAELDALTIKHLAMITTNHFGNRNADTRDAHPKGRKMTSEDEFQDSAAAIKQLAKRGDVAGMDVAGIEHFQFDARGRQRFQQVFGHLLSLARGRGTPVVFRPHVGEGGIDVVPGKPFAVDANRQQTASGELSHVARARDNLEQLLLALEGVAVHFDGTLPPEVIVRFGHATHATPGQAARMKRLGVIVEVNLTSNRVTGALPVDAPAQGALDRVRDADSELPRPGYVPPATRPFTFEDHSLATLLFNEVEVVLSTDGHEVMNTTLRREFLRALDVTTRVRAGRDLVKIDAEQARAMNAAGGAAVVPEGAPGSSTVEVSYQHMSPEKKAVFDRAYRRFYETAQRYVRGSQVARGER